MRSPIHIIATGVLLLLILIGCDSSTPEVDDEREPPTVTANIREYRGSDTVAVGQLTLPLSSAFPMARAPSRHMYIDSTLHGFFLDGPFIDANVSRGSIFFTTTSSLDDHATVQMWHIDSNARQRPTFKASSSDDVQGTIDLHFITLEDLSVTLPSTVLVRYQSTIFSETDTLVVADTIRYHPMADSNFVENRHLDRMSILESEFYPDGSGLAIDFNSDSTATDIVPCFVQVHPAPQGTPTYTQVASFCTFAVGANPMSYSSIDVSREYTDLPGVYTLVLLQF